MEVSERAKSDVKEAKMAIGVVIKKVITRSTFLIGQAMFWKWIFPFCLSLPF